VQTNFAYSTGVVTVGSDGWLALHVFCLRIKISGIQIIAGDVMEIPIDPASAHQFLTYHFTQYSVCSISPSGCTAKVWN